MQLSNRSILITPGEPAGIGPDIVIKIAQQEMEYPLVILADPDLLEQRAKLLKLPLHIHAVNSFTDNIQNSKAKELSVFPIRMAKMVKPGEPELANAKYVLECLRVASDACLQGQGAALVTGPVNKAIINAAGFPFAGHTQYLAELTQQKTVVMFFASPKLRLALITDHLPLHQVSRYITKTKLSLALQCIHSSLQKWFRISSPKLYICGLNPHAGEEGYLGKEEQRIIKPVLERLNHKGLQLFGPGSADTAFQEEHIKQYDAIVAMYHDQGLPIFKHLAFGESANITLGLPYLRTSVDHGTALSIAGTGKADESSLRYVLSLTRELIYAATT